MNEYERFGRCRYCGRQILWIKTKTGKAMPCDPEIITYHLMGSGRERVVTPGGDVYSARRTYSGDPGAAGFGYISHFATCPGYRKKSS